MLIVRYPFGWPFAILKNRAKGACGPYATAKVAKKHKATKPSTDKSSREETKIVAKIAGEYFVFQIVFVFLQ